MRSQSDCCSYYPLQRLKLRKLGETPGGKNEKIREEKEASARCHTQDSHYPGSTFSIFNLHAWDHYDQTSFTPCSQCQWSQLGLFG